MPVSANTNAVGNLTPAKACRLSNEVDAIASKIRRIQADPDAAHLQHHLDAALSALCAAGEYHDALLTLARKGE